MSFADVSMPEVFTVKRLAETLATLPPDMPVYTRVDDVMGEVTSARMRGDHVLGLILILE